ncbi:NgoFVII family restriction endonuclease [Chlamydiales bacterium]|nr:NgoFVII family restriction endonuclease [Chlamydiales bacterium]
MLHYKNLNKLFFESYPQNATDFIALSGFLGPDPIIKLEELPLKSTIIYGLQKEKTKGQLHQQLHQQLINLHNDKIKIFYPDIACHSKCYLWLDGDKPIKGLIGSANFSSNGLFNDYRETLFEVDMNQLYMMHGYIKIILDSSKECNTVQIATIAETKGLSRKDICEMILYDPKTRQTQMRHGLNWGFAEANVTPNDACVPIRVEHIRKYPELFPPLQPDPDNNGKTLKEVVEYMWDDGVVMQGRLEGSQSLNESNFRFPKQLASYPKKNELGIYIRKRMNIPLGKRILIEDLERYGRDIIAVSTLEDGVYYLDFSV